MIYDSKWLLAAFAKRQSVGIEKYRQFVAQGTGQLSPWVMFRKQMYRCSDQFVEEMQALIDGDKELSEIPSSQRRPAPNPLAEYKNASDDRNTAIISAYQSGGYTLKEIGDYFGLHYSSVSGIFRYHKSKT
ncbi:MAG: hypothetical protein KBT63_00855 [Porticoccaceae bacterium]|nr:hypothetical protein [Porticoccaceae bacterium]